MTSTLHPYPAYKPSRVEWLGDVPAYWEVRRVGTIAQILNGATPSTGNAAYWDGDIAWITPDDLGKLNSRYIAGSSRRITEQGYRACGTNLAPAGSIAISTRAPIGHLGILRSDACVNQGCRLLVPGDAVETEYMHYALSVTTPTLASFGQGSTFTELSRTLLAAFRIPLPPLPEQRAIVCYLDHVDRRIRRYVVAKRKLIALLEEEKQAIVNQAVTRGLDSNVRLKPSGVEWLGHVPEHWELPRLRNLGNALIGLTYAPQDLADEEDGMLVLRASNIANGQLVYGDNVYVSSSVPSKLITQEGDILICSRSGSRTLVGKNARIDADSAGTTFGAFMTVFRGPHNDYLHQVFNSKFFEYQSAAFFTSTINQLTLGILYDMKVPFPPGEERLPILQHIEDKTTPVNKAIARARRQIELVNEYRTRLIADVVTGKLDVREAAALLPEAGEAEPMDGNGVILDYTDGGAMDGVSPTDQETAIESEVTA